MRDILPWSAIFKGLYMLGLVILFAETMKWVICVASIAMHLVFAKYTWSFYVCFALFFGCMEIVIVQCAHGQAWVYTHPDILGIPLYLIPLWSIVTECIVDFHAWGLRNNIWTLRHPSYFIGGNIES